MLSHQPAKRCSRDGCAHPVRARGMCKNHYDQWRRARPEPLGPVDSCHADLLEAMPGTLADLAATCVQKYDTVRKAVERMHDRDEVHVSKWQAPEPGQGHRWVAVFAAGEGEDAKLPRAKKRAHARARNRARYAENKGKKQKKKAALYADVFNLTGRRPDVVVQPQGQEP